MHIVRLVLVPVKPRDSGIHGAFFCNGLTQQTALLLETGRVITSLSRIIFVGHAEAEIKFLKQLTAVMIWSTDLILDYVPLSPPGFLEGFVLFGLVG